MGTCPQFPQTVLCCHGMKWWGIWRSCGQGSLKEDGSIVFLKGLAVPQGADHNVTVSKNGCASFLVTAVVWATLSLLDIIRWSLGKSLVVNECSPALSAWTNGWCIKSSPCRPDGREAVFAGCHISLMEDVMVGTGSLKEALSTSGWTAALSASISCWEICPSPCNKSCLEIH